VACGALAMRNHNRDETAIGVMIGAMAPAFIKESKNNNFPISY
jgi:hypothetical protein